MMLKKLIGILAAVTAVFTAIILLAGRKDR